MKRKTRRVSSLVLALALTLAINAQAQQVIWGYSEGMALVSEEVPNGTKLWGYANAQGKVVIPIQYDSALTFSLGLAQVRLNGRLGVIRQDGTYLIEPAYLSLSHISSGLFIAQKGSKWGVISILPFPDGQGGSTNVLYDFIYDSATIQTVGNIDTLVLTQGDAKVLIPSFDISTILLNKNVPSARFPLRRNALPAFTDVSPKDWYALWVDLAYNLLLMEGVSSGQFAPNNTLTLAEAISLAARMESRYRGDDFQTHASAPIWYRPAVDYCVASGIIREGEFTDFTRPITRAEMARIFGATSLGKSLPLINNLDTIKTSVPDVSSLAYAADAIYGLYAKGILTGNGPALTFRPTATLTRAEAAAIVSRMARTEQRVTLWPTTPTNIPRAS